MDEKMQKNKNAMALRLLKEIFIEIDAGGRVESFKLLNETDKETDGVTISSRFTGRRIFTITYIQPPVG